MDKKSKHTRRNFIKAGVLGTAALTIVLWDKMIGRHKEIIEKKTISVPFNLNREVNFFDEFIVVNSNGKVNVLSSRCTHLGCIINNQSGDSLLCPCHGSAYNLSGEVIKGPAIKPLKLMEFEISTDGSTITVKT